MSNDIKANLSSGETWKRGLFIILFAVLYSVAEVVLWAVILFQFGSQLITSHTNERLLEFTRGLNAYIYYILQYISYRSDEKPYPFDEWPGDGIAAGEKASRQEKTHFTSADREIVEREDEGETETGV